MPDVRLALMVMRRAISNPASPAVHARRGSPIRCGRLTWCPSCPSACDTLDGPFEVDRRGLLPSVACRPGNRCRAARVPVNPSSSARWRSAVTRSPQKFVRDHLVHEHLGSTPRAGRRQGRHSDPLHPRPDVSGQALPLAPAMSSIAAASPWRGLRSSLSLDGDLRW